MRPSNHSTCDARCGRSDVAKRRAQGRPVSRWTPRGHSAYLHTEPGVALEVSSSANGRRYDLDQSEGGSYGTPEARALYPDRGRVNGLEEPGHSASRTARHRAVARTVGTHGARGRNESVVANSLSVQEYPAMQTSSRPSGP